MVSRRLPAGLRPSGASLTLLGVAVAATTAGCKPDLEGRPSLVDSPRVLAIRSQPAEVKPGEDAAYDVLVAQPSEVPEEVRYDWALCKVRKPLAESGPIADACLQPSGSVLDDLGASDVALATLPADVCQTFGPVTPIQKPGEPAVRPEDPDTTGGYYQPVRLLTRSDNASPQYEVGVTRIFCGIALGASQENTLAFNSQYHANVNPGIGSVEIDAGDTIKLEVDLATGLVDGGAKAGATMQFNVSWAACSPQPSDVPCTGAEAYPSYDPAQQALVQRRESIRVSWFASEGAFEHDRTGRTAAEAETPSTSNTWLAPGRPTTVHFWLVIRDDRRGVGWATFDLAVVA